MRPVLLALFIASLLLNGGAAEAAASTPVPIARALDDDQSTIIANLKQSPAVVGLEVMNFDIARLASDPDTLELSLFGEQLKAEKLRSEALHEPMVEQPSRHATISTVWYGNLMPHKQITTTNAAWQHAPRQDPRNSVTLVQSGSGVEGAIVHEGQSYQIRTLKGGLVLAIKLDATKVSPPMTDEVGPISQQAKKAPNLVSRTATPSSPGELTQIDVMAVVHSASVAAYGADMLEHIQLMVAQANQSYLNSNIAIHMRLVAYQVVDYRLPFFAGLITYKELQNPHDGVLDESYQLRNQSKADAVVLVHGLEPGDSGHAFQVPADAETAFAIVQAQPVNVYVWAHEIGHLQGARHRFGGTEDYPFAGGYLASKPPFEWYSIMAYDLGFTEYRYQLNLWSNPEIYYDGVQMGNAENADNHRVLEMTKEAFSQFR